MFGNIAKDGCIVKHGLQNKMLLNKHQILRYAK
ncbi:MAG: hypothetical protein ACFNXX_06940 [Veillonella parvula]